MRSNHSNSNKDTLFWILAIIFIAVSIVSVDRILKFGEQVNPFIYEFYAGILGSVITVAAMTVVVRLQSQHDKQREFSSRLFEKKIELYSDLLRAIFTIDDDNIITMQETQNIETKVGNACLVAGESLVSTMSQFVYQLKVYGVLYVRSMQPDQLEHFIDFVETEKTKRNPHDSYLSLQKTLLALPVRGNEMTYFISLDEVVQEIRDDLNVVEGDVRQEVEHFVRVPYNYFDMIKDPNLVDAWNGEQRLEDQSPDGLPPQSSIPASFPPQR
ncbi:MAG: hypothetical protein R2911_33560 [Caldilineaceae bacterium]